MLLRTAHQVNRQLHERGYLEWNAVRGAKAAAKAALEGLSGKDRNWVLVEAGSHLMWIPRRSIRQYVLTNYEPFTTALLQDSLGDGAVMLDIGAHVGFFTLRAARSVGASGHVYAFEPAPGNLSVLERNVVANGYKNVSCYGQAVADRVGRVPFILAEANDSNSFYPHPLSPQRGTLTVDCVTVDSLFAGKRVDVVKIDAEGAEIAVLKGMTETIRRNGGLRIFVELNPFCQRSGGHSARELIATLRGLGLSPQLIEESERRLRPLDESLAGVPQDAPSFYVNLLCTRACR